MASLYFDYARVMWTADDVKNVFNNFLNENIVASVEEWVQTGEDGVQFKSYMVHFLHSNLVLEQWFSRISSDGFVLMPIDMPDYVKKGAERYWKLLPSFMGSGQSHVG